MLRQATLDEQQHQQQVQQEQQQQQQQQQQVLSRLSGGSGWGDDLNASSGASSSGVSFDGSMSAMNMEGGGSSKGSPVTYPTTDDNPIGAPSDHGGHYNRACCISNYRSLPYNTTESDSNRRSYDEADCYSTNIIYNLYR